MPGCSASAVMLGTTSFQSLIAKFQQLCLEQQEAETQASKNSSSATAQNQVHGNETKFIILHSHTVFLRELLTFVNYRKMRELTIEKGGCWGDGSDLLCDKLLSESATSLLA